MMGVHGKCKLENPCESFCLQKAWHAQFLKEPRIVCAAVPQMPSENQAPSPRCTSLLALDGCGPEAGLLQATDGNFYGTAGGGGANGCGTVFRITSSGILSTVHNFTGSDGSYPRDGLI